MRCPACGLEADPTAGLCRHCRAPLHMPPGVHVPGGPQLPDSPHLPGGPYVPGSPHLPGGPYVPGSPNLPANAPAWGQVGLPPGGSDYGQSWPASGYQVLEPGSGPGVRRHPWIWVVVVLAVVFAGAAATGVVLKVWHKVPKLPSATTPSSSPSPSLSPDGRSQAMAIDALLSSSSKSRGQLGPALDQVEECGDLNAATATLQQVVTERDDQVRQGQSLAVDQLEHGDQLRTLLVQALTYSRKADQSFVTWAHNAAGTGCTGKATHDADYAAAQAASANATTSKQSFVQLWNPIATKYGLPTRSESSF
jgi:hypothetical protein